MNGNLMEKVVALCKRRGFIYPGSEIYGGLAGTWDYGPLGVELKNNIKKQWWKDVVYGRDDVVGIDAAIMMNPRIWEASGHVEAFTDPLVECKVCHQRFRADKGEEIGNHESQHQDQEVSWTKPRRFNLLVKAYLGVVEERESPIYLRGEVTQGVHVNFKNVVDSTRVKVPFGIAQVGKAFRNEITPGNFTFRSREFEQMEIQFFIKPDETGGQKWYEHWKDYWMDWYTKLGIKKDNLRFKDHQASERAHYAKMATDLEYQSPWGWAEFMGIHHRGDWDLKRHQEFSGQSLEYRDPDTGENFIPWDIESSAGVDRSLLFFLIDAYSEDNERVVLKLHPRLAPYKVAVFPLLANKIELLQTAQKIYDSLRRRWVVAWDDRGNIGKRYFGQDEIGTPFCVTVDFQSLGDQTVTVRDRNTTHQDRIKISEIEEYLKRKVDESDN